MNAESPLHGRVLLVVGSRRSGTFWLQRILTAHSEISGVPSETYLFSHGVAPLLERIHQGPKGSPQVGSVHADRDAVLAKARELCDIVLGPFLEGRELLVERTPFHVRHLDLISELYPGSRVLHIIRDGRDVARSLCSQDWGPDSIAEAAGEWERSVSAGRDAHLPPDRYCEVRYEQLLADPERGVEDLLSWLDLDASGQDRRAMLLAAGDRANVGRSARGGVGVGKWKDEWSNADLAEFERTAGSLLAELGYAVDEVPSAGGGPPRRGSLRRWLRRNRGATQPSWQATAPPRGGHARSQRIIDSVVGGLASGDLAEARSQLGEGTTVTLRSGARSERAIGEGGGELLARVAESDPAFTRRQLRADSRPGLPWSTALLYFEGGGGPPAIRAVMVRLEADLLREVEVHTTDAALDPE